MSDLFMEDSKLYKILQKCFEFCNVHICYYGECGAFYKLAFPIDKTSCKREYILTQKAFLTRMICV